MPALLARRGVGDPQAARAFLTPSLEQLHDPFLLAGMEDAVGRLTQAREAAEPVAVVGDYDVDGVSATALLVAVLRACGIQTHPVLPHRLRDGYGFKPTHVERAQELGCRVIVTVDCGISSGEAVAEAQKVGLDVIVTDHHLPGEALPEGVRLINPRQDGCSYPFPDLAGVGLALKLSQALADRLGRPIPVLQLLRIACLGTIADLVPLVGENRTIASLGLDALSKTRSVGLCALMERAGIKPPLSADDVGYRIGPRINAAGRLASPDEALELLLSRDPERAEELAGELEKRNRDRQEEERKVVDEARERIAEEAADSSVAVAWSEGWHRGVVGIAAGRLARERSRPTLLFAVDGDSATGSGRSVPGISLHGFFQRWEERYESFGGHDQAIGMTVPRSELEGLRREWAEAATEWPDDLLAKRYEYELALEAEALDLSFLESLSRLEPHGQKNPRPLLRVSPLRLTGKTRHFGKGHLSATARGRSGAVKLLGWRWQEREQDLAGEFEALGYLELDNYTRRPVLRLVDARGLEEAVA